MVGTCQVNRTGAGKIGKYDLQCSAIAKGSYKSLLYQHKEEPLTYAIWGDNNFVKTLSNFHTPNIVQGGVKRKRRSPETNRRELTATSANCPEQIKDYCETFHLIDKGNGAEAKFDLGGESHHHGWSPKLAARLFNMHLNNVYTIYCSVVEDHSQAVRLRYKPKELRKCIVDLAHTLLKQGETMRTRDPGQAPPAVVPDVSSPVGRKKRTGAKKVFRTPAVQGQNHSQTPMIADNLWNRSLRYKQLKNLSFRIQSQPWRIHQSVATLCDNDGGDCQYRFCPGKRRKNKRKRAYPTRYRCEQCSVEKGTAVYLCNTSKLDEDGKRTAILCHIKYHTEMNKNCQIAPPETAETAEAASNDDT